MGMAIRKAMGLVCVIAAAVPPYVLYAKFEDGNMRNPGLFLAVLAARSRLASSGLKGLGAK